MAVAGVLEVLAITFNCTHVVEAGFPHDLTAFAAADAIAVGVIG